jgi:5,6-dimethylbenzimidazole synthase
MPKTIEYSVVAAITVLMLAARAAGISVGWISILDPIALVAALDVPKSWQFVGYLCLGYAAADDNIPMLEREDWETRSSYSNFIFRR